MENNSNNKIKLFKRFLKDIGQYTNFNRWVVKMSFHKMFFANGKNYNTNNGYTLTEIYANFSGEDEYANAYTAYLTAQIGAKEAFEIFKNFIETKYGIKTYNDYVHNISTDFIKEQTESILKLNDENNVLSLPANAYLFYAFHWEKTPQGHDFWSDINNEWFKTAETILSNYIYQTAHTKIIYGK
jgi:hypothetical protein